MPSDQSVDAKFADLFIEDHLIETGHSVTPTAKLQIKQVLLRYKRFLNAHGLEEHVGGAEAQYIMNQNNE